MPKDKAITSDSLHNENCYFYLKELSNEIPQTILDAMPEKMSEALTEVTKANTDEEVKRVQEKYRFGDLYHDFFKYIENNIDNLESYAITETDRANFNKFVLAIYHNDNKILENTFAKIKDVVLGHAPIALKLEKAITSHLQDNWSTINAITPAISGSNMGRIKALMAQDFKPQHTTSLSTIRHYNYQTKSSPTEYRFGTQGQRHEGKERVSPLFSAWLHAKAAAHPKQTKIDHIYFNNLGLDRSGFEGNKEKALTHVLHGLEADHKNVAVITLPADKGILRAHNYRKTNPTLNSKSVFDEFLAIASQDPKAKTEVKDFFISPHIRSLLFGETNKQEELTRLLKNSFDKLGVPYDDQKISLAQQQAVWFDFIKFELPNHIIAKLNPESINFSCKDAIDRGGVSSAYYNLMKSIEQGHPLSREEFDRGLHAAPAMVKGRGMNHHQNIIWNAMNEYVNKNYATLNDGNRWMVEWRDLNCPHERVGELLKLRIEQEKGRLSTLGDTPAVGLAKNILQTIENQSTAEVSGKRLLLETVSRTTSLITPTGLREDNGLTTANQFDKLVNKLNIKFPTLNVLAGLIKSLIGLIPHLFSKEKDPQSLMHSGIATIKAGMHSQDRNLLITHMKDFKTALQNVKQEGPANSEAKPVVNENASNHNPHS